MGKAESSEAAAFVPREGDLVRVLALCPQDKDPAHTVGDTFIVCSMLGEWASGYWHLREEGVDGSTICRVELVTAPVRTEAPEAAVSDTLRPEALQREPQVGDTVRVLEIAPYDSRPRHAVGDVIKLTRFSSAPLDGFCYIQSSEINGDGTYARVELVASAAQLDDYDSTGDEPADDPDYRGADAPIPYALTPAGERMVTHATGAQRADGAKPLMHLLPHEVLRIELPSEFRGLIDWWRGDPDVSLTHVMHSALKLAGDGSVERGLLRLAEVYTYGAAKYSPRNWELGLAFSCCYGSAIRHALKAQYEHLDAVSDGGSGLPHLLHYAWNVVALWTFVERGRHELDDRAVVNALPVRK